jgi:hypothetical protein
VGRAGARGQGVHFSAEAPQALISFPSGLSRLSASADEADRHFADAIEEALVRAEHVEQLKQVNWDLRDRLTDRSGPLDGEVML